MSTVALTPVETAPPGALSADLRDAWGGLDGVAAAAAREGFPEPSARAFGEARRLLPILYRLRPGRIGVSPKPDGEIALEARGGRGSSVVVRCRSDGGIRCSVDRNGRRRWADYSDGTSLPDGFLREALADPATRLASATALRSTWSEDDSPVALLEARRDLDAAAVVAVEDGFSPPPEMVFEEARRLLPMLYRLRPCSIGVDPTPDGEIALEVRGGWGESLLVICGFEGGVLCSLVLHGRWRQAWYDGAVDLPDGFLREALRDLGEQPGHAT